ncbi:signal recognition particle subunit SRP68 [Geosmithia morbida]|uniref:Signal recognition particle subunit SRP68 n=1 Tax=Geosmithia morbida TaxID=1094350 RepID=A0A9P5D3Z1_9HYPO|nr:signal recognition particle subunit SRP68 [Geosmithia morbida]KAF4126753.1 signal recognition particle subunit SRP68 [Geosmithia morbida]
MDITSFVVQGRDKALLYGDYSTYHASLAKRLVNSRRKLGIATKNRGKFNAKREITADDVTKDREYVYLSLLTSERAFAQAMSVKASHTSDQKGIVGRTRSHIISRLVKAAKTADELVETLSDAGEGTTTTTDLLEATAYASMIRGAASFEKQNWESCLRSYSTCRIIYAALAGTAKGDVFNDLLSETIDPSIRYAAYRLNTPRTVPISDIARKAFPQSDTALVDDINKVDPDILKSPDGQTSATVPSAEGRATPPTLIWRSREVKIEDAQIAQAWGSVLAAKIRLSEKLQGNASADNRFDVTAAYEEVLTSTQDAVDATKQAIDELRAEGVGQGDSRMQSLQITRTAVNYEMIIWRIGRNRVLTGTRDGAVEEYGSISRRRNKRVAAETEEEERENKEPPPRRKLAKLKEKVALYNGNLQNLQSIKDLPGVAADEDLAAKLDATIKYFESLSSALSIARSHSIIGNVANALALINHALSLAKESATLLPESITDEFSTSLPLSVDVGHADLKFLSRLLAGELQRHRAIAHIDHLRKGIDSSNTSALSKLSPPLVERLHDYPAGGAVHLSKIVQLPPRLDLAPVKPIFLDVAWNYIDYPGKTPGAASAAATPATTGATTQQPAKKGWFGFGRS